MKKKKVAAIFLFVLAIGLTFASGGAHSAPFLPDFSTATFAPGEPIDNSYFPLLDNLTRIFVGDTERFELTNLGLGPTILGVQTTRRRDRAFEDDLLIEDTFDYYAQDTLGNVWYFGEDVTNYIYDADGNLIGTNNASAWRAGLNGALPGYVMPADLTVGFNYYQEFAPLDDALDQGLTFAVGIPVSIGIGNFTNVLQVLETTELDPEARGFKYYAPGHGLILEEEGLDANFQEPELTIELVQVVPEPTTFTLLGLGLAGILGYRRPKKNRLYAWGR